MLKINRRRTKTFLFFGGALFLISAALFSDEEVKYDPYVSIWKYPKAHTSEAARKEVRNKFFQRFLEQPFRPLGYGLGKGAEWVEEDHVDKKVIWVFDKLEQHGIFPGVRRPSDAGFGTVGVGGRIELDKLFKIKQPYLTLETFGGWAPNFDFVGSTVDVGARYKVQFPSEARLSHEASFRYGRSSSENFFGIGQHTSRGDWVTYSPEETKLDGKLRYQFTDTTSMGTSVTFQRMNIGNGNRERVGKIKEYFSGATVPGINGATLLGYGAELKHDTRDHEDDPKRGGEEGIEFSYFHDVGGDDIHYFKFLGSIAHFFPFGSDRRILAFRLATEKNKAVGDAEVPFFNLARLGGSKRYFGSELLRSYRFNRFFDEGLVIANVEYRYNIWEYGDVGGDAVALADVGEVFGEIKRFVFGELRVSYGGGLNIKFRRKTIFSFVVAHGSEGLRFSTQTKVSF